MQKQEFENDPLDIGSPVTDEPQWFKVEGRLGERIHPIGPKFTTGHVKAQSLQHAKESYLAYMGQFFTTVEVMQITPVGQSTPQGVHVFPAKRNLK